MTLASLFLSAAIFTAAPSNCRFYLAGQYNWGKKLGYYLDFEGSVLKSLPVILAMGDGTRWRFLSHVPGFEFGRQYSLRAVVSPGGGKLYVDGRVVGEIPGSWRPVARPLEVCYRPPWATEPGDWMAMPVGLSVELTREGKVVARRAAEFPKMKSMPPGLYLFHPDRYRREALDARKGDTVLIEATVRFEASDPAKWAPLVDRYGQCRYGRWPTKVTADDQLRADIAREDAKLAAMQPPADFDKWGGYKNAGWREQPTGFYRAVRRKGYWWLVTPEGYPCFYTAVDSCPGPTWPTTPVTGREKLFEWLPPRKPPWAAAWSRNQWGRHDDTEYVCFHTCNLIRKYGPDKWLDEAVDHCTRRLRAFGFGGVGKWGGVKGLPQVPVLWVGNTPRLAGHPDIFDPAVCEALEKDLRRRIEPRRDDPTVVGWSLGNEMSEIIKRREIEKVLAMGADVAAKRALVDYALDKIYAGSVQRLAKSWGISAMTKADAYAAAPKPPPADVEKLRLYYEDRYWAFIYRTVKRIDPNHLYFGNWIVPGWWESEGDWEVAARHCDVLGYDRYSHQFADQRLRRLLEQAGKPVLCGEFSFPPFYDGWRGFGRYGVWARDDADAGELYFKWVRDAATNPYCVGVMWFQYRDQPITGRGPGRGFRATFGEHFAFGLITVTDRVKWDLVSRMRQANLQAPRWRLDAMSNP